LGESKLHVTWSEANPTNPNCIILQGHQVDVIRGVLGIESRFGTSKVAKYCTTYDLHPRSSVQTLCRRVEDRCYLATLTANFANAPAYKDAAPELFSEFFAAYHNEGTIVDGAHLGTYNSGMRLIMETISALIFMLI